jgi:hypothetical protein
VRSTPFTLVGCALLVSACSHHDIAELVKVVPEPEGPNCQFGGQAIETGVDHNQNGVLDDSEVSSVSYVCKDSRIVKCSLADKIHEGTVTLQSDADFAQLDGITCLDGDLVIESLPDDQIPSLPDLEKVTGSVLVTANPNLRSLTGLVAVHEVGSGYVVDANPALTDITALGHLIDFGTIFLVGNDTLENLHGLEVFTDISISSIVVKSNPALTSLSGLDNLTSIEQLTVQSNASLTSLDALANVGTVSLVDISGNPKLTAVKLPALELVQVRLLINTNAALTAVSLPKLTSLGDGLQVAHDGMLKSVDTPSLVLTGNYLIQADTSLTSVSAPHLSYATVDVTLSNVPALTTVDLGELGAIGGSLTLQAATVLPNLSGFAQLSSVGANATISTCNALSDFTGIGPITTIPGNLTITSNARLSSLAGLEPITEIDGNLLISGNTMLPVQVSNAFASHVTVFGTTTIN